MRSVRIAPELVSRSQGEETHDVTLLLHQSNRLEALADELAKVMQVLAGGPLEAECIVVQGQGMERWVSMRLAERFGVWAGAGFPFPRKILSLAIEATLGEGDPSSPVFEPGALVWALATVIRERFGDPELAEVRRYLDDDPYGRRRVALSERIADTFDQYAIYRPDLLARWEKGDGIGWQPALWRALVAKWGGGHSGVRIQTLVARLRSGAVPREPFPKRISLFGVSTLPPLYLEAFDALAGSVETHLFLLGPTPEYWADLRSPGEIRRRSVAGRGFGRGRPPLRNWKPSAGLARPPSAASSRTCSSRPRMRSTSRGAAGAIREHGACFPPSNPMCSTSGIAASGLVMSQCSMSPTSGRDDLDPQLPRPHARSRGSARSAPRPLRA